MSGDNRGLPQDVTFTNITQDQVRSLEATFTKSAAFDGAAVSFREQTQADGSLTLSVHFMPLPAPSTATPQSVTSGGQATVAGSLVGFDAARDCGRFADRIKAANVDFVARYYSHTVSKNLSASEAQLLSRVGLKLVAVWEFSRRSCVVLYPVAGGGRRHQRVQPRHASRSNVGVADLLRGRLRSAATGCRCRDHPLLPRGGRWLQYDGTWKSRLRSRRLRVGSRLQHTHAHGPRNSYLAGKCNGMAGIPNLSGLADQAASAGRPLQPRLSGRSRRCQARVRRLHRRTPRRVTAATAIRGSSARAEAWAR